MTNYIVQSGEIQPGRIYKAYGDAAGGTITYGVPTGGVDDDTFVFFTGVQGIRTFTTTGNVTVIEVFEFKGSAVEFAGTSNDQPTYSEVTKLQAFVVEYSLNESEKIVQETTKIQGFAIELVDYPFYCFEITETCI